MAARKGVPDVLLPLVLDAALELLLDAPLELDEEEPHALSTMATEHNATTAAAAREARDLVPNRNGVKRDMISSPCASRAV
jgi:hypothetical protein